MEATGGYETKLAQYLYDNNFKVSVINPARIKGFSVSKLSRVKTDKADSKLIAWFCQATLAVPRETKPWVKTTC